MFPGKRAYITEHLDFQGNSETRQVAWEYVGLYIGSPGS